MKHLHSLFSNNKKNNDVLIDNVHNDADNSNQTLLKQGSTIVAQGEKPFSNAVVGNDINKSNDKNAYQSSSHTKSTMIASYYREGTCRTTKHHTMQHKTVQQNTKQDAMLDHTLILQASL